MTIREFLNNGADIRCNVRVRRWCHADCNYSINKIVKTIGGYIVDLYDDEYMDDMIHYIGIVNNELILEIREVDN